MGALLLHGLLPAGTTRVIDAPDHVLMPGLGTVVLISQAPPDVQDLDPEAMATLALRHHSLLAAYCPSVAVLPMRFGSVFSSTEALRRHLAQTAEQARQALQTLAGLREYTLRLSVAGDAPLPERAVVTGRDFLARGRDLRDLRLTLADRRTTFARRTLAALGPLARQIEPAAVPRADRMLDLACLIPLDRIAGLADLTRQLGAEAEALGLDLRVAGPWPAYSFKLPARELCHGA